MGEMYQFLGGIYVFFMVDVTLLFLLFLFLFCGNDGGL